MADKSPSDVFSVSVSETIRNWSVIIAAKEHGFGGTNANEKESWLSDAIVQIFQDNDTVYPDELEDFVSEALFNEFDTIVEDGTIRKICDDLCAYYYLCQTKRSDEVLYAIEQMKIESKPPKAVIQEEDEVLYSLEQLKIDSTPPKVALQKDNVENEVNEEEEEKEKSSSQLNENEANSNHCNNEGAPIENNEAKEPEEDDGWQVVRRSKKK